MRLLRPLSPCVRVCVVLSLSICVCARAHMVRGDSLAHMHTHMERETSTRVHTLEREPDQHTRTFLALNTCIYIVLLKHDSRLIDMVFIHSTLELK